MLEQRGHRRHIVGQLGASTAPANGRRRLSAVHYDDADPAVGRWQRGDNSMANDDSADAAAQVQRLVGALEILEVLREEMAQWLEEAQDSSKQECLENVHGHISAMEANYRERLLTLRGKF
jgi:hypothetical protein